MLDFSLMVEVLPKLWQGVGMTGRLSLLILLLALVIAVPLAFARNARTPLLNVPAQAYILFFRGTPALIQVFLVYYGAGQFVWVRTSFAWTVLRDPFWCLIIALGLNGAAYSGELFAGAMRNVPSGLVEAARALGLSWYSTMRTVVLPLAIRSALPAYSNEIVLTIKATSLASTITILDLTGMARLEVARTYAPYEVFLVAGLIYLAIILVLTRGLRVLERRWTVTR
ncbi:ABC transporter permease [Prosthecodimorpha staleyi]|uniref:ABC transporter permease subunit n=1 Tax=Prosthecodimorpha staleyi TaxID=2840188 RepID=A0A947D5D0_9HYPH|nr:ABC transporter permease subunit [Prosthecodimorpha staleyi]MBT9289886.1 ABC transporter permease subunit [Prosthecodimorpha staleyi]